METHGSLQSKIMAMVLSMAAEIERDLISQRTRNALATRKPRASAWGRPGPPGKSKLDQDDVKIRELIALKVPQKRIAEIYHTTEANLSNWMKKRASRPPARNSQLSFQRLSNQREIYPKAPGRSYQPGALIAPYRRFQPYRFKPLSIHFYILYKYHYTFRDRPLPPDY